MTCCVACLLLVGVAWTLQGLLLVCCMAIAFAGMLLAGVYYTLYQVLLMSCVIITQLQLQLHESCSRGVQSSACIGFNKGAT